MIKYWKGDCLGSVVLGHIYCGDPWGQISRALGLTDMNIEKERNSSYSFFRTDPYPSSRDEGMPGQFLGPLDVKIHL